MIKRKSHFKKLDCLEGIYASNLIFNNFSSHLDLPFDDPSSSPIGNYPRMKATYGLLKDPYTYWDVQGRRNYGELIHDQDLFTDVWGIGPEQSPAFGLKLLFQAVAFVSLVATGIWVWNPEKHSFRVFFNLFNPD